MAGDPTGRISHRPEFHRGVSWKQPCRVATTANITIATALNAGDTIDGVVLAAGDRVLVKDQTTGSQNGIYYAGVTPARDFDMDQDGTTTVTAEEVMGALVYVIAGTVNTGKLYRNTNTTAPTLGTTSLTFAEVTTTIAAGTYELAIEGGQSVIKAHGAMGATETFDPTDGNVHTGTLDANCTFTLNVPTGSGAATLEFWITQDGTGGRTITWPGSVTWDGGTPTPSTTAGVTVRYILESIDGGTNWVGDLVGGSGALSLTIKDEGVALATAATSIDFVGAGVIATGAGAVKSVTFSGAHAHIVNEPLTGDGSTTVFLLAQEADDAGQGIAAWVSGVRVETTLGGANDQITFGSAPSAGATIRLDYLGLLV